MLFFIFSLASPILDYKKVLNENPQTSRFAISTLGFSPQTAFDPVLLTSGLSVSVVLLDYAVFILIIRHEMDVQRSSEKLTSCTRRDVMIFIGL